MNGTIHRDEVAIGKKIGKLRSKEWPNTVLYSLWPFAMNWKCWQIFFFFFSFWYYTRFCVLTISSNLELFERFGMALDERTLQFIENIKFIYFHIQSMHSERGDLINFVHCLNLLSFQHFQDNRNSNKMRFECEI